MRSRFTKWPGKIVHPTGDQSLWSRSGNLQKAYRATVSVRGDKIQARVGIPGPYASRSNRIVRAALAQEYGAIQRPKKKRGFLAIPLKAALKADGTPKWQSAWGADKEYDTWFASGRRTKEVFSNTSGQPVKYLYGRKRSAGGTSKKTGKLARPTRLYLLLKETRTPRRPVIAHGVGVMIDALTDDLPKTMRRAFLSSRGSVRAMSRAASSASRTKPIIRASGGSSGFE